MLSRLFFAKSLVGVVFVWVLELIVGVCGAFSDLAVSKAPNFSAF